MTDTPSYVEAVPREYFPPEPKKQQLPRDPNLRFSSVAHATARGWAIGLYRLCDDLYLFATERNGVRYNYDVYANEDVVGIIKDLGRFGVLEGRCSKQEVLCLSISAFSNEGKTPFNKPVSDSYS